MSNDGSCWRGWSARSPAALGARAGRLRGALRHEGVPVLCRAHRGGGREVQVLRFDPAVTQRTVVRRARRRQGGPGPGPEGIARPDHGGRDSRCHPRRLRGGPRGVESPAPAPESRAPSGAFNVFVQVENACEVDGGTLVTTDAHGTPMAFATPDGPERFWCVSRQYLTSIGHRRRTRHRRSPRSRASSSGSGLRPRSGSDRPNVLAGTRSRCVGGCGGGYRTVRPPGMVSYVVVDCSARA